MKTPPTVAHAIEDAAARGPDTGFRFVAPDGGEAFLPFPELERETARYGGALQALGLGPGDRVALILPDNRDFVLAFLGAIRAGVVPVPIYPPAGLRKLDGYLRGAGHVVRQSGASALVTDAAVRRLLGTVKEGAPALRRVVPVEPFRDADAAFAPAVVRPGDTCFLQFTSGSTAAPRGVVVRHRSLAANIEAFMGPEGLAVERGVDTAVSWLPLYHDMGLIGFVLGPLTYHCTVTFLPPLEFLKRPARWLREMSDRQATISFGPSFGYSFTTARARDAELEGVDLSRWRAAGCGAEPIRPGDLRAFAARFAPLGFDPRALLPCYGLAEATLAVSFDRLGRGLRTDRVDPDELADGAAAPAAADAAGALEVVSCGRAFAGHEVAVFHTDDAASAQPLPDRAVGEIRLRGPSLTAGYFDQPEETARLFAGGWLRTGDLGYLADGELYVTGRHKELIIVAGRNYYPQDLEAEATRVEGVRQGKVIAFGTGGARERVVVVFETRAPAGERREALAQEVRRAVRRASGLGVDDVLPLDPGILPKTSSGKLKRTETRRLYEAGELAAPAKREAVGWSVARAAVRSQIAYARDALKKAGGRP